MDIRGYISSDEENRVPENTVNLLEESTGHNKYRCKKRIHSKAKLYFKNLFLFNQLCGLILFICIIAQIVPIENYDYICNGPLDVRVCNIHKNTWAYICVFAYGLSFILMAISYCDSGRLKPSCLASIPDEIYLSPRQTSFHTCSSLMIQTLFVFFVSAVYFSRSVSENRDTCTKNSTTCFDSFKELSSSQQFNIYLTAGHIIWSTVICPGLGLIYWFTRG